MKTSKFFLKILILAILFQFLIITNSAQASPFMTDMYLEDGSGGGGSSSSSGFWSDIFKYGDNFVEEGKGSASSSGATDQNVQEIMDDIYSIVFPLGVVVTVIVGGILGIKFMLASAEDKAKVKESMVPYVVGCIVIYGAFGIWRICIQVFSALG